MKLAVVGGGNTAFAMAAASKLRGFEVSLLEAPEFKRNIEPVLANKGIQIRGVAGEGLAGLDQVTTDPQEALPDAAQVYICVPAYAHRRMAELILPYLRTDQVVLLMPGNAGGALEFVRLARESGIREQPRVAEASSCLFAVKKEGPAGVWVRGLKQGLPVAAFPARESTTVVGELNKVFDEFAPASHVLETSLTNINHMVHPPGTLLNSGHVELAQEDWPFFGIGISPAVCRVIEAIDAERLQILDKFGLPQKTVLDWMLQFYGHQGMQGKTLYEAVSTSPVYKASKAPHSLHYRYVTEDVPYGLVPLASLGRELGISTPALDTVIALAGIESGRDWWAEGRTASKMGLAGMTAQQMVDYVTGG